MNNFEAVGLKHDRFLILCSILYVILPPVIFSVGWIKPLIAVPVSLIFLFAAYKIYSDLCSENEIMIFKVPGKFWLYALLIICAWVLCSGIGGFSFQNGDFVARNPTYRDLCDYSWPVKYDLANQSEAAQKILGSGSVVFAYYFSWWLPPALVSKIFNFAQTGRDICVYIWAVIGMLLVFYNLCRYLKKASLITLIIFIFFSGLDIIGYIIYHPVIIPGRHIEWWTGFIQYSSMTTLLFWVFNQSIAAHLIVILLLQLKDGKNALALSSLTFAFSPWVAIGIIPIALNSVFIDFKNFKDKLKDVFTFTNISVPLAMLLIYGLFYTGSTGGQRGLGGFTFVNKNFYDFIVRYSLFCLLEFGIYFIILGKSVKNYKFYYVVLAELILIPLYELASNLIMRASIPAVFCLMVYVIKFLLEDNNKLLIRKRILIIVLILGACTPFMEFTRCWVYTALHYGSRYYGSKIPAIMESKNIYENIYNAAEVSSDEEKKIIRKAVDKSIEKFAAKMRQRLLREEIYSFGRIAADDEGLINLVKNQFFMYDYENRPFFKYVGKMPE